MSNLQRKDVEYDSRGLAMRGYFSIAGAGPATRPGVLIVPDAFGLESHAIGVADRLAEQGFAAFALDLWGARRQFARPEHLKEPLNELLNDRDMWMARMAAAHRCLQSQAGVDSRRIAAIGYCLGGATVLEAARAGHDIRGVVSFHGGLDFVGAEWDGSKVKAKLLVLTGIEDPLVPWTALTTFQDNVRRGGVNWELDVYCRAKHSFTRPDAAIRNSPDRVGYDPQADGRSWRSMLNFLEEVFPG